MTAPRTDVAKLVEIWTPANGLDLNTPVTRMDLSYLPYIQNFKIQDGYYVGREGTKYIGTVPDANGLMASMVWQTPAGVEWIIRFSQTQPYYWDAGLNSWMVILGIFPSNLTGNGSNYFQWAGWGSKILFVNGKDGLYEMDFSASLPTVTQISTAPVAPRFVTTFGGRVVVSNIANYPGRIQWSVKNDSTDWTGIGSGSDDLISTPGGGIDQSYGVYPINDAQALVVRAHSIWLMSLTGDANAPHRFSQLYANFGCDDPYSVVLVPGGIIGLFKDNVYFVNETTIQPIGNAISSMFRLNGNNNPVLRNADTQAIGAYDPDVQEYRLAIRLLGASFVMRYGATYKKWTQDWYPVKIKHIAGFSKLPTSSIVNSRLIMTGTDNRTFYETGNWLQDVSGGGGYVEGVMELVSGVIRASDPYHKTRLIKVFVEYEYTTVGLFDDVEMKLFYSYDNSYWELFPGSIILNYISDAAVSRIASTELTLENRTIQLKAVINSLRPIKIYSVMARVAEGTEEPQQ